MPNTTVPAAGTGLPKSTRRQVIAGLAAAPAMIASPIASGSGEATLSSLYARWREARLAYAQALYEESWASDQMLAAGKIPEVAQFRNQPRNPIKSSRDCGDDYWEELRDLANSSRIDGKYQFREEAYTEMAARVDITAWAPFDPNEWIGGRRLMQDSQWIAPYCPPLRERVREILEAYLPWKAKYDQLAVEVGLQHKRAALESCSSTVEDLAFQIAALPAVSMAGRRTKATVIAVDYLDRETAEDELRDHIQSRSNDAFHLSLAIDLADWDFIREEAHILAGDRRGAEC
ncbi:MAG TPA: hypothetical protein VGU72_25625 [Beijerinckiaceae bacterium]|jgi:hypothetical protein|nr:hypothetical protein [Beijerinckiaceae bacterium]